MESNFNVIIIGQFHKNYERSRSIIEGIKSTASSKVYDKTIQFEKRPHMRILSRLKLMLYVLHATILSLRRKVKIVVLKDNIKLAIFLFVMIKYFGRCEHRIIDLYVSEYLMSKYKKKNKLYAYQCEKLAISLSTDLLVLTEEYKKFFRRIYRLDNKYMTVVPLSVNRNYLKEKILAKEDRIHGNKVILYWGNYRPQHNILKFVSEFAKYEGNTSIELRLAGDPKQDLEELREASKNNTKIKFLGFLPQEYLIKEIMLADYVLGHLSLSLDAMYVFPNKMIEGMALGRTVIVYRNQFVRRVLRENDVVDYLDFTWGSVNRLFDEINLGCIGKTSHKNRDYVFQFHCQKCVNRSIRMLLS